MGPLVVIKADHEIQHLFTFLYVVYVITAEILVLNDAIDPFGNRVVPWVAAFGHTDPDIVLFQDLQVFVTAILQAPVRMVC